MNHDEEDLFAAIGVDVSPDSGKLSLKKPVKKDAPKGSPSFVVLPGDLREHAAKVIERMVGEVEVTRIVLATICGDREERRFELPPGCRLLAFYEPKG